MLIPLVFGRSDVVRAHAVVDDEAHERVSRYRWHVTQAKHGLRYACRWHKGKCILLHQEILGETPFVGAEVDHRNRDGLDNRRQNLRWVTRAGNMQNRKAFKNSRSGLRGVYKDARKGSWVAQVRKNGRLHRRWCRTEIEAATVARAMRQALLPCATD